MPTPPKSSITQAANLRGQCEAEAVKQRMYNRRSDEWLTWEECAATRIAVVRDPASHIAIPRTLFPVTARRLFCDRR